MNTEVSQETWKELKSQEIVGPASYLFFFQKNFAVLVFIRIN